jgi:hypothetical protein
MKPAFLLRVPIWGVGCSAYGSTPVRPTPHLDPLATESGPHHPSAVISDA